MIRLNTLQLATCVLFHSLTIDMFKTNDNPEKHRISSFAIAVSKGNYVDKSLFIKEFIDDSKRIIAVTAPCGFGKSVNIGMLKTFLSIQVDDDGNETQNKTNTNNYKLFKNSNLFKKYKRFFDLHFGNYPVVFIDYGSFTELYRYDQMIENFRKVLQNAYLDHNYLSRVRDVWRPTHNILDIRHFNDYVSLDRRKNLTNTVLEDGFQYLCEVLFAHFKRKVIVLVDNYNSHITNIIFKGCKNMEDIIKFIETIHRKLFENQIVEKVFLTGIINVKDTGLSPYSPAVAFYSFLRNHTYGQYYGITGHELEELLIKHTKGNPTEIKGLTYQIKRYYNGYTILYTGMKIFNFYSVLQYLEMKSLNNYWTNNYDYEYLSRLFYMKDFREEIITLLQNGTIMLNISDGLFKDDILALMMLINNPKKDNNFTTELVFKFLFEMGFLTNDTSAESTVDTLFVRLPNLEIEYTLAEMLKQFVCCQYNLNLPYFESVNKIINTISDRNNSEDIFKTLYEKLSRVFLQSSYTPQNENDFQSVLFSIFRYKFPHTYTEVRNTQEGGLDIWLRNDKQILFIIETKIVETKRLLRNCTQLVIDQIIRKGYVNVLDPTFQKNVVYLGICYSTEDKIVGLGCSRPLNVDDGFYTTSFFLRN